MLTLVRMFARQQHSQNNGGTSVNGETFCIEYGLILVHLAKTTVLKTTILSTTTVQYSTVSFSCAKWGCLVKRHRLQVNTHNVSWI